MPDRFPTKAMVLAAGCGTRLQPLTDRIPKCMVPIGGKPLIEHTIQWLADFGVDEIIINLCHLPQAVMEHFADGQDWGVNISYSIEKEALGTAGGVRNAAWFFDGPFFVWYGDNLSKCRLDRLLEFHHANRSLASIALFKRDDVSQSGIVELSDKNRITRFLEKPNSNQVFSNWVNAGIYLLDPEVLKWVPGEGASDFSRDVFPTMLSKAKPLYGYKLSESEGLWWIDRPEDLSNASINWRET